MLQIGGVVVLFACVFGGYLMTGGSLSVVIEAAPHEMLTIFGAAIAAMLIAGSPTGLPPPASMPPKDCWAKRAGVIPESALSRQRFQS